MGTIRIEYVPVQRFGLGFFGLDHLQVVYQDETDPIDSQDYWYVIEGVQEGPIFDGILGAVGESGRTSLSVVNGASRGDLINLIGTPETRGSRVLLSGPDVITQWDSMASYAADIENQALPYVAYASPLSVKPTINSTSLIATLLWSIGFKLGDVMPYGIGISPGGSTLIGTASADELSTTDDFDTLVTGDGNDTLRGSDGGAFFYEKLYGGAGDDTFHWSNGSNILHGGQPNLSYAEDGKDVVDYTGVGVVTITADEHAIEHKVADFSAIFAGGSDQLFSIEKIDWDRDSDTVIAGEGVEIIERPLELDLQSESAGRGDELGMQDTTTPLIFNYTTDYVTIQTVANAGQDAGYWARSLEWIAGSRGSDLLYAGPTIRGAEGGDGDDLIDARGAAAFTGLSPAGYDIEIDGGSGNDTLISGTGLSLARGGAGDDRFILGAMSGDPGTIEFVIEDAEAGDSLLVPYDFFRVDRGDFDGSALFQLTGAPFRITETEPVSYFEWSAEPLDQVNGYIQFTGSITYAMDGSDLIITLMQGHPEEFTPETPPDEPPAPTETLNVSEPYTETIIRVRNWSEGELGLDFPIIYDNVVADQAGDYYDYPGLRDAMQEATSAANFFSPLDIRPEAHVPQELMAEATTTSLAARLSSPADISGGDGDDVLVAPETGVHTLSGGDGDDDLTGGLGGDILDGGAGADAMRGGRGNDTYYVDDPGDVVIEQSAEGFDRVVSAIDYILGDDVEHLALAGTAVSATGNALRNRLEGNDGDNVLDGGDGDDTLAGNLGDDTLAGGAGSDGYVYEAGDGRDIIIESADGGGDRDVLVLAGALTPADLFFLRDPDAMTDLTIGFADGGRVIITDYFSGNGAGIEAIDFSSGTTWESSDIAALAASAVEAGNFAPIAADDVLAVGRAASITIPAAALLDNDRDDDGDELHIASVANASGGTAELDAMGNVLITPDAGTPADAVSFDYVVADAEVTGSTARVSVGLIASVTNTPPQIVSATLGDVIEDQPAYGAIVAEDADGDPLQFAVKEGAGPIKGSVAFAPDGTFTYTPNTDENGADSFTVTVTDGINEPVEYSFAFSIAPANESPLASDDGGYYVRSGDVLRLPRVALLDNDADPDGGTLQITSVAAAVGGTAALTTEGDVLFTAQTGFSGAASFQYTLEDGQGGSSVATVSITVDPDFAANHVTGTIFRDVLEATAVEDIISGRFASDTFVFGPGGGHDVITDFSPGWPFHLNSDVLDLTAFGLASFGEVMQHAYQDGNDTLVVLDEMTSIRLADVSLSRLDADNFRLL